ncbi:ubiquitin-conjugating protein DMA2 NDAI_0F02770 [Naumovozyma dairenensis CBS 421]|uniref:RING-type E3 ubiquitin transferase n=1 Tax=Naumovozyma dairenensis (strain ATCC 10597 / BCRC 20456 / CBS 421 / NBRC 0211 / NRRL Y-12639) TaxID=1071378 RepID=G0WCT4_NAUDC|nr:hypothetical protein NDAI_0F02770 [Naumovozyma dairenensis CBS 421]CCD25595.1 hypothetical protein NDAI_0F02770 [Naumovozyma dairenensis CBS 421]
MVYTPIPVTTNTVIVNQLSGSNSSNNSNHNGNTPAQRSRGSSFNALLTSIGIRQQHPNEQRLSGSTPFASNLNSIENLPAIQQEQQEHQGHQEQQQPDTRQDPRIQMQIQSQAHLTHSNHSRYHLPISLSLTALPQSNANIQESNNNMDHGIDQPQLQSQSQYNTVNPRATNTMESFPSNTASNNVSNTSTNPFFQNSGHNTNSNNNNNNNNQQLIDPNIVNSTNPTNENNNDNNILNSKNLRHFVYGPDQKNVKEILSLDLPPDTTLPDSIDSQTLQERKNKRGFFSIRLTPFIDTSSTSNQGLFFDPVIRTAGPGSQLVIGRYTERVREAISKIPEQYHPVVFKSKVVSRTHGCFKVDEMGNWFVRDVKSSSGTFLNHQRLSPASTMSKDILLHDGDIIQLGMDFRGGTEEIYRCVRMRVELNRSWKLRANAFNKEALQRIKNLQKIMIQDPSQQQQQEQDHANEDEDCSICLSKIKACQAIFISPCAHSWHFHCIRRLVMLTYPQFVCPNCRSACDLEASLESSDEESESELESEGDQIVDIPTANSNAKN